MRPVIGIDIGFSTSKKSCGLGAMHCSLPFRTQKGYCDGEIRVSTFRLADLVHQLQEWRDRPEHAPELDKAIVLIDGPVGEKGRCTTNRTVDRRCSSGAFRLRCQAFQVEQSHEFINAVEDVIEALAPKSDDRPFVWTGGPVPLHKVVIAETNPTVALATLMPRGNTDYLVSWSRPRRLQSGAIVRCKSDWYWACGGRSTIAEVLGTPDVINEADHDHVAALVCLGIGAQLTGQARDGSSAIAIGDSHGVYVLPDRCHADWRPALAPFVFHGALDVRTVNPILSAEWDTPLTVNEQGLGRRRHSNQLRHEPTAQIGQRSLRLTDTGAVHESDNAWLQGLSGSVMILTEPIGKIVLTKVGSGWKLRPTAGAIARSLGFILPLSKAKPVELAIHAGPESC